MTLERYLEAATRQNTQRSYASALRHFEIEWGGHLPATPDSVARYLADHAAQLASNTLRQRLAALAHWHREHGFVDPTRAPLVRKVLRASRLCILRSRIRPSHCNLPGWLRSTIGSPLRSKWLGSMATVQANCAIFATDR